jgi:hypothetical protein
MKRKCVEQTREISASSAFKRLFVMLIALVSNLISMAFLVIKGAFGRLQM